MADADLGPGSFLPPSENDPLLGSVPLSSPSGDAVPPAKKPRKRRKDAKPIGLDIDGVLGIIRPLLLAVGNNLSTFGCKLWRGCIDGPYGGLTFSIVLQNEMKILVNYNHSDREYFVSFVSSPDDERTPTFRCPSPFRANEVAELLVIVSRKSVKTS